jgi:ParB family chromosome partitioning protein
MSIATIPFHLLKPVDEINARASKSKDGIDELAASIAAKGLIQPLAVRRCHLVLDGSGVSKKGAPNAFVEIIDGRRRYQAMQKLVKAGTWTKQQQVPVLIREDLDDADALETSLMANMVRLPMHPVDQFAVFARLVDKGSTTTQIAERFGIAERTVRQHMALGALAPEIRDAWKKGKIDQKIAQLFTLSTNHDVQAAAFKKLAKTTYGLSDYNIRHELANDRPKASSMNEELLQAYTDAGGTISESLFEDDRYVDDGALLRKVRNEAREPLRQKWLAMGWAWVKFDDELDRGARWKWRELSPKVEYTPEEKLRLDELEGEYSDEAQTEEQAILDAAALRAFTPEMRAKSGVILDEMDDTPMATFGLVPRDGEDAVRDEDPDEFDAGDDDAPDEDEHGDAAEASDDEAPRRTQLSAAIVESLSTALTAAVQEALPNAPELALRFLIATLATGRAGGLPMNIHVNGYSPSRSRTVISFDAALSSLEGETIPELIGRLSVHLANAVDLRVYNPMAHRLEHRMLVDRLPSSSYLPAARKLFSPADYFARVPKEMIEAALAEMGVATGKGAKKTELAALATREATELGWLPEMLRHPAYKLIDPSASEPAQKKRKGGEAA